MKKLILFTILLNIIIFSQTKYQDYQISNSVYTKAPDEVKNHKSFIREWKFYDDRAYPDDYIPDGAYQNAVSQKNQLRIMDVNTAGNPVWVSLGPTSGYYYDYGNISSRIVTGAFNPLHPDTIYIGPANGGIWKSTNGGINWTPLTDDQASLSMGCIVLDPVNPEIVYAGTGEATYSAVSYYGAGLLKSTDGGVTWARYTSGLPGQTYFSRLVIRPGYSDELLAALGTSGLYRSTNGGQSWTLAVSGRCDDVLFSQSGDTVFIAGSGTGLRRSVNGGLSFSAFGTGLTLGERVHFDYCKAQPNFMYAAVFSGSTVAAYKSTNYGANWSVISSSVGEGSQAWYDLYCRVNPADPNIAYIGLIDIFKTSNGGTSFVNITNGYNGGSVHVDQHFLFFHPDNPSTFISCNDGGIYKSTNSGSSFINLNQNLTLTQFYRIAADPTTPAHILGGTQDNGTQQTYSTLNWAAAFGGDGGEVCFNPFNSQFILGESQNGYLARTSDGGTNWYNAYSGINTSENAAWVAPIIADPVVNGTFYTARQRVYKSTNNGASWTAISGNLYSTSAVREMEISYSDPNLMFASVSSLLFKSTDRGLTWSQLSTGLPSRIITSIRIDPRDKNIVLVTLSGFGTSKIYKSTNAGSSWTSIHGNLPDSPINDCVIYTSDILGANTYFAANDVGVFVTRDNGITWNELANGLPNTVIMHLDYNAQNKMLRAGTHGRGVYEAYIDYYIPVELSTFAAVPGEKSVLLKWTTSTETNNRGFQVERKLKNKNWETLGFINGNGSTTEPQNYNFSDNFSGSNYEGRVLYRLEQVDMDGTAQFSKIVFIDVNFMPQEAVLYQNYPNPFNPSTTIAFSVPVESYAKVAVYNQLGEEITILTSKNYAPGLYNLTWDAAQFSSGVYYCKLEVTDNSGKITSQTKKLIFTK